jgi:hypothetical protein
MNGKINRFENRERESNYVPFCKITERNRILVVWLLIQIHNKLHYQMLLLLIHITVVIRKIRMTGHSSPRFNNRYKFKSKNQFIVLYHWGAKWRSGYVSRLGDRTIRVMMSSSYVVYDIITTVNKYYYYYIKNRVVKTRA